MKPMKILFVIFLGMFIVGCSNENKVNNNDVNVYDYYSGEQRKSR